MDLGKVPNNSILESSDGNTLLLKTQNTLIRIDIKPISRAVIIHQIGDSGTFELVPYSDTRVSTICRVLNSEAKRLRNIAAKYEDMAKDTELFHNIYKE